MNTGLFVRGQTEYDNAPAQGRRDVARALAAVAPLIESAGRDPATYAVEYADSLTAEMLGQPAWANKRPQPAECPSLIVHRAVADKARMLALDLLAAAFRPAADAIPYTGDEELDEPVRSRLFARLEVEHVQGIDANARRVGGEEPTE